MEWTHNMCGKNRLPKSVLTGLPEERRRRGRPEIKWKTEVKRVMKHKNLGPKVAVKQKIWRKVTEYKYPVQHWNTVIDR